MKTLTRIWYLITRLWRGDYSDGYVDNEYKR